MNWSDHIIFHFIAGSHLYGTANENSDEDHRGVIIPPVQYFYGLDRFDQWEGDVYHNCSYPDQGKKSGSARFCSMCDEVDETDFKFPGDDCCFYDIRKFVRLAMKGNPNIIEYFWAETNVMSLHPVWIELRSYKQHFLSKAIVKPHIGMAESHIKKLDVPGRKCGVKGRKLIEQFGYNTKDAACVMRILWQCYDLLTSHHLDFPRDDADILVDIIEGQFTLADCKEMIGNAMAQLRDAEKICILPATPNYNIINKILIETVTKYHTEYNL